MYKSKAHTELLLFNELDDELRLRLQNSPEHLARTDSSIYLQTGQKVIRCDNDSAGNELVQSMVQLRLSHADSCPASVDLYYRLLTDTTGLLNQDVYRRLGSIKDRERCIILFWSFFPLRESLYSSFSSFIPTDHDDIVVPVSFDTVAIIKDISALSRQETIEYAAAVADTLEAEGISGIRAGISRECSGAGEWRNAYVEAYQAVMLGVRYHENNPVYHYALLTLERILDAIPETKREEIRRSFYRNCPSGELPDELLETVRVFFDNDLNLTATAKQLFIHRNTLNYRLDKIHKALNLDLRSFHDAAVFKIISGLPKK